MKNKKIYSILIEKTLTDVYKFLNACHYYMKTQEEFYNEFSKFLKECK